MFGGKAGAYMNEAPSLTFVGKAGAYPSEAPFRCSTLG